VTDLNRRSPAAGLAYGLAAYLAWGFIAIYFKQLKEIAPLVVLSHRVIWSVAFLVLLLIVQRQLPDLLRCIRQPRTVLLLLGSTAMIGVNWYTFIWSVSNGHVVEASFGYFITPLISVLLAVVVLKERLRAGQLVSTLLAVLGAVVMSYYLNGIPVISLTLAISFGMYGLLRKVATVGPLVGLSVETALLFPVALGYLLFSNERNVGLFDHGNGIAGLLMLGGVVTAFPLLWFAAAARRLRLATLGFLQYLAPTCQLLLAVVAYGEPFTPWHAASFGLIWLAIAVFTVDAARALRGECDGMHESDPESVPQPSLPAQVSSASAIS
jgi:chloramphenicol-sensitive protein RarD